MVHQRNRNTKPHNHQMPTIQGPNKTHINYNKIMENDNENLKWEATQINHIINRINKLNKPRPTHKTQFQVTPPNYSVRPGQPGIHNITTTT